jgi:hypothetical protein
MIIFGPGTVTVTPANVSNPTPYNIGLAEEISYEESFTNRLLFGQNRRAIAVGAGTIKATGKIKAARWSLSALSWILYGTAPTTGQTTTAVAESQTVPAVSTYTITVANAATFSADQGVVYQANFKPLTRVASGPTVGQYSVNTTTGVYTFGAADASAKVYITYNYTVASNSYSLLGGPQLIGPTVTFSLNITTTDPTNNNVGTLQIFNAVVEKWTFGNKLEDFNMPEIDYQAYANPAGQGYQWNSVDNF